MIGQILISGVGWRDSGSLEGLVHVPANEVRCVIDFVASRETSAGFTLIFFPRSIKCLGIAVGG